MPVYRCEKVHSRVVLWASKENTTRRGDVTYCFPSILSTNMPFLSMEKEEENLLASRKKQSEFNSDHTIIAFDLDRYDNTPSYIQEQIQFI
jgi:hypothetical protein